MLADDSHVISYLIFFLKLEKMSQILSSAEVVIGPLRVNLWNAKFRAVGIGGGAVPPPPPQ